ncbi:MAG TPA: histidine phosphatase family protein [Pyrinomonadaceae bacterium]|nr:histidine phosphatase family protein [Pyrinomonadaceae bacterium]
MSLTVCFLRHGQTALSRSDVFCGSGLDPELTPEGLEMAQAFAAAHRNNPWTAIVTSKLRRTIQTAQPLCEALQVEAEVHDGLNEIGYGKWEGLTKEEVDRAYHDDYVNWLADPAWHCPTDGELAVEVARRSLEIVEGLTERFSEGNVLVVSHKATIRIILCSLLGIDVGRFRYRFGCPVGSISTVDFTSHGPFLKVMADRSHLSERLKSLPGT